MAATNSDECHRFGYQYPGPNNANIDNINHDFRSSFILEEGGLKHYGIGRPDGLQGTDNTFEGHGCEHYQPINASGSLFTPQKNTENILANTKHPIYGPYHTHHYGAFPEDLPNVHANSETSIPLNDYINSYENNHRSYQDFEMNPPLQQSHGLDNDSEDEPSSCIYRNLEEAMEAKNKRRKDQFKNVLQNLEADHDIPTTEKELRRCVKQLSQAIKDTSEAVDKPPRRRDGQLKDAQAVHRMKGGYYSPEVIEQVSWQITHAARAAQAGVRLVDPYHKTRRQGFRSFGERFNEIVKTCKVSKAACKQLMDAEFIERLVDAPCSILKQKLGNMELNGVRNMQVLAGRKAIEKSKKREISMTTPQDGEDLSSEDDHEEKDLTATQPQTPIATKTKKTPKSKQTSTQAQKTIMTPTSSKRKDLSFEVDKGTPSKKPKSTPQSGPIQTQTAGLQHTDLRSTLAMSVPPPLYQNSLVPVVPPSVPGFTAASTMGSQPLRVQDLAMLNYQYRRRICRILGVDPKYANKLSLRHLRIYARAYNIDYLGSQQQYWYAHELACHGCSGVGYLVQPANSGEDQRYHLVVHFPELQELALARGDIDENLDPVTRESGIRPVNQLDGEAMGTSKNVFGPHDNTFEVGGQTLHPGGNRWGGHYFGPEGFQ